MKESPEKRPVPRWVGATLLALSLIGLGFAAKLTDLHWRVHTDPNWKSFCAYTPGLDCDAVALSPYSVAFGAPVSVWGLFGYALIAATGIWLMRRPKSRAALASALTLTTIAVVAGVGLGLISAMRIKSVCLLCSATYVIDIAAFLLTTIIASKRGGARALLIDGSEWAREHSSLAMAVLGGVAVAALAVSGGMPKYWKKKPQGHTGMAAGMEGGHPWIGAANPKVTITEYSDYECPYCRRGHQMVRQFVQQNKDEVRLVHRNYPLDKACNPNIQEEFHQHACRLAFLAVCAGEQGRFWEANDYLFDHARDDPPPGPQTLSEVLDIDRNKLEECIRGSGRSHVLNDIKDGDKIGVEGTPTFQVGNQVLMGELPFDLTLSLLGRGPAGSASAPASAAPSAPAASASAPASAAPSSSAPPPKASAAPKPSGT